MMHKLLSSKWFKVPIFLLCLVPFGTVSWRYLQDNLGANPIEFITHTTGDWALRFLVLTLAVSPLRKILGLPELIRFRRMLGLFAFFYASLHFSTYIVLDKFFDMSDIWKDVLKRRFITVGFAAFLLLIPLALTSTAGSIRRLGGKRWQALHRLIYLSAILAVIHYYWLVKSAVIRPLAYGAILAVLLFLRVVVWLANRRQRVPAATTTPQPTV